SKQVQISSQILTDIKTQKQATVYQMLMGEGKSSVIAPYTSLCLLAEHPQIHQVVNAMPETLSNQSEYNMIRTLGNLFSNPVMIVHQSRYDYSDLLNLVSSPEYYHSILLISDSSLKSLKLNQYADVYTNESQKQLINEITKMKWIILMDEIDEMSDPLKSELNYPTKSDRQAPTLASTRYAFMFELLVRIYQQSKTEPI